MVYNWVLLYNSRALVFYRHILERCHLTKSAYYMNICVSFLFKSLEENIFSIMDVINMKLSLAPQYSQASAPQYYEASNPQNTHTKQTPQHNPHNT